MLRRIGICTALALGLLGEANSNENATVTKTCTVTLNGKTFVLEPCEQQEAVADPEANDAKKSDLRDLSGDGAGGHGTAEGATPGRK